MLIEDGGFNCRIVQLWSLALLKFPKIVSHSTKSSLFYLLDSKEISVKRVVEYSLSVCEFVLFVEKQSDPPVKEAAVNMKGSLSYVTSRVSLS